MAKGTKKKAGAKGRMPKAVAGVKMPKEVRDFGGIGSWVNTHLGREILAEALVAAAGAAAVALRRNAPTAQKVRRLRKDVVATGTEAAAKTKEAVQSAVSTVSDAVAGVAHKLLPESAAEAPAPRRRGRPKSVKPAAEAAAAAAPAPRRRGPRAARPAGAGPGRPRKPRGAASEPTTTEAPKE